MNQEVGKLLKDLVQASKKVMDSINKTDLKVKRKREKTQLKETQKMSFFCPRILKRNKLQIVF